MGKVVDFKTLLIRSYQNNIEEVRFDDEEGTFDAYFAVWETIDSYNTSFNKGCFKRSIEQRFDKSKKVKLLYNHDKEIPIGHILELREDEHGAFIRGKLDLNTQRGQETHSLMKSGAINTMSFGFKPIQKKWVDNHLRFDEVALFEVSPVVFEANENAEIISVRGMDMTGKTGIEDEKVEEQEQIIERALMNILEDFKSEKKEEEIETRDTDFNVTLVEKELRRKGYLLNQSLMDTLDDINWEIGINGEDYKDKILMAIDDYKEEMSKHIDQLQTTFGDQSRSSMASKNELSDEFLSYLLRENKTVDDVCKTTSLTEKEVLQVRSGKPLSPAKMAELSDEIAEIGQVMNRSKIKELVEEIRAGDLTDGDKQIINALIGDSPTASCKASDESKEDEFDIRGLLNVLKK